MDYCIILDNLKVYDPNYDEKQVIKSIEFAIYYHQNQLRESGQPYYHHPLNVAKIVAVDMKLDSASVITAILHDTVEDTELTLDEVAKHFGQEIAKLVDGVTKLSKIEFMPDNVRQAENFRKLLLAMSEDIRVLLVKLADRLDNMRTIDFVKSPEKRTRKAMETMEIYTSLAERIGMQQIKSELQDICFRVLHPKIRESIIERLEHISDNNDHMIEMIVEELNANLIKAEINAKVYGRKKTPYSIWMKMQNKQVGLEQLSDIIAFRIIANSVYDCYKILGVVHDKYQMVHGSFQDFISTPKSNNYQSLHTIVIIGELKQKIEIQIRTSQMHDIAELGVAAHWKYKQQYPDLSDGKQYLWINELLSILSKSKDSEEFLHDTKLAMYYDQVFCFSINGDLIALPKGATIIDFAYAVDSKLGNKCIGAKVNNLVVPLRSLLNNGDQVEIITSPNQSPSAAWEKFVVTGKAKSEIKRFLRNQNQHIIRDKTNEYKIEEVNNTQINKISFNSAKEKSIQIDQNIIQYILQARIANQIGSLALLTQIISNHNGNITNFNIIKKDKEYYDVDFEIQVNNKNVMDQIILELSNRFNIVQITNYYHDSGNRN
ncbi:MAG: bifunctional (p)ppGpp synthetase/guanosine-3',5'-bis(diphosphate) 3'-pyrophosphohydrolase [Rickettsiaceae bacterium]